VIPLDRTSKNPVEGCALQSLIMPESSSSIFSPARTPVKTIGTSRSAPTRKPNEFGRQIDDFDRLPHVQQEDARPDLHRGSLQHQEDGFGRAHEVAPHLRMRQGDGTAAPDLVLNQGMRLPRLPRTFPNLTARKRVSPAG